ncbi:MAG: ankyrin repeat domain-containing protein [Pseudomonadota bacterium]
MDFPDISRLRRAAKALKKAHATGDAEAVARLSAILGDPLPGTIRHADALHVIAREAGYDTWPRMKDALEAAAMDRAEKAERLKMALYHGQKRMVDALLQEAPDLGRDNLGLACALYDLDHVTAALAKDKEAASRIVGVRAPMLHLAFSRYYRMGGTAEASIAVAEALIAAGADVDASYPFEPGAEHRLSALYGAMGHAGNLPLARWLLEHGADPNDNESLYHATELGTHEGLEMLIAHGARPEGTNALPRALDFNDEGAVRLLLEAGADPNEGVMPHPSGEAPVTIPALHQAARRMASGRIVQLLLDHGANPADTYRGHTAYALARVYGNTEVAEVLEQAGAPTDLGPAEAKLVAIAEGRAAPGDWIDMDTLSEELKKLLTRLVWRPGTLPRMKRLVDMGFDPNATDEMGLPPLHVAGWEGLPEKMAYFLSLKPDMAHVNGYGGTLFSTILHGSENCPHRGERDHIACMKLALEEGAALPKDAIDGAIDDDMAAFLSDWAAERPGQVVENGAW